MRFGKPVAVAGAYPLKARRGEQTSSPIICGTEARPMTWWRWSATLLVSLPSPTWWHVGPYVFSLVLLISREAYDSVIRGLLPTELPLVPNF